jgi:hypothetical protein
MSAQTKKIYLLDTNVLINLYIWLPIHLNNVFWSKLGECLKNGEWVLLDAVVNEIIYQPELKKWCAEQKRLGLIKAITEDHKNRGVEINNQYPMIDISTSKSTVDTYLIAYAEANKLVIFSRESPRKKSTDLFKIPDVCTLLKVERIKEPKVFLETLCFKN